MPNHKRSDLEKKALNLYSEMIAIYGLLGALKIIRQVLLSLKKERTRRRKLPKSERGFDDTKKDIKKTSKSKSKSKKKKGPGMAASLYVLFEKKGVNKVTYQDAKSCAKKAKPDSDLSQGHFRWYKKKFKDQKRNK